MQRVVTRGAFNVVCYGLQDIGCCPTIRLNVVFVEEKYFFNGLCTGDKEVFYAHLIGSGWPLGVDHQHKIVAIRTCCDRKARTKNDGVRTGRIV